MALRTSRPPSLLQDENAQANMAPGKAQLNERKGLQHQQQQERKKLSNITNHVLSQPKLASKANIAAEKESFSIRADVAQDTIPMSAAKKVSRPPLKNISNGIPNPTNDSSSKPPTKPKAELRNQTQNSTSSAFQLPPRSRMNLTEEMKKKAAMWAEEGIETVHFTGEDMENQRCMHRDEEIAQRVAMIRNCRADISFPSFPSPRHDVDHDLLLKFQIGDFLEPEVVKDLSDDDDGAGGENEALDPRTIEELLRCTDYFTLGSPPRFTEGWPRIREFAPECTNLY